MDVYVPGPHVHRNRPSTGGRLPAPAVLLRTLGWALTVVAGFLGCAPAPVLRLEPVAIADVQRDWSDGRRNAWRQEQRLHAETNFVRSERGHLVLAVRFHNPTESAVVVRPERFYYQPIAGPTADAPVRGQQIRALDPEKRLLDLDLRRTEADARYETDMTVTGLFALLDLAVNVASAVSDDEDAHCPAQREDEVRFDWWDEFAEIDAEHENRIAAIENQRDHWSRDTLRTTTLYPGETIGGLVAFPSVDDAEYLRVVFPVEREAPTFVFRQTAHRRHDQDPPRIRRFR